MIRAKVWFRCAAMHDPVTPVIIKPAVIGWDAKHRKVDLTIERAFNGEELAKRMKGWVTIDPRKLIRVVNQFGRLTILDDRELVAEVETLEDFETLQKVLAEDFGQELELDLVPKK